MRALHLQEGTLTVRDDAPEPTPCDDEVRVRVLKAGVCATDLALARGYMGFEGIPGHEFVGEALDGEWAGQRVVGEINAACGRCESCRRSAGRHCPDRSVLGILNRPGAFAEMTRLPASNLLRVPDGVPDEAAVFVEPLAAALRIAEQLDLSRFSRALVAGDGRLGLLCAWALHLHGVPVCVAGRHPERSSLLPDGVEVREGWLEEEASDASRRDFDLAVEATGAEQVLPRLLRWLRPEGTLVLKTTTERPMALDLAPFVVDEIAVLGSRCGRFAPALEVLRQGRIPVERWVDSTYRLDQGVQALERAGRPGVLKVLLEP